MNGQKQRIWELDALRGFCILCVIFVHVMVDLVVFVGMDIRFPPLYQFIQSNGGVIFVVLSGICITLGSRSARRGAIVLACGMVITLVTWVMEKFFMPGAGVLISFGVLHLLGVCMLVYPLFKKLPTPVLAILGICMVVAGYMIRVTDLTVQTTWLFPLGLTTAEYASADYFPLLPHLGWYLLGIVLGRTLYADKKTKFPKVNDQLAPIRFFCFCGRQSLWIYILHQPLVYGVLFLIFFL